MDNLLIIVELKSKKTANEAWLLHLLSRRWTHRPRSRASLSCGAHNLSPLWQLGLVNCYIKIPITKIRMNTPKQTLVAFVSGVVADTQKFSVPPGT